MNLFDSVSLVPAYLLAAAIATMLGIMGLVPRSQPQAIAVRADRRRRRS